ncbi:hypothetical protein Ancab_024174 [Ancistrocladus abbreviatus]
MATNLLSFQVIEVRDCATSGRRISENERRKDSSPNWCSLLFGFSSDPDYIDSDKDASLKSVTRLEVTPQRKQETTARSRFAPGRFTEEKARQLRKMTTDAEYFHAMYHSAIASRLASDFSNRSDLYFSPRRPSTFLGFYYATCGAKPNAGDNLKILCLRVMDVVA